MGPAASCHLWWVVVESSSFASGRAAWALRRLRGWVIRVLQIAERGDAGLLANVMVVLVFLFCLE